MSFAARMVGYTGSNVYATWNPSDKSAAVTLSGGNLICSWPAATIGAVRSTISKTSGKWYWEVVMTAGSTGRIGVADSAHPLSISVGNSTDSWGYSPAGTILSTGLTQTVAAYTIGDVIGLAYDAGANTISFYMNNAFQYTATGLPSGMYAADSAGSAGVSHTANFGATTLTYSPPAGYNAGLYI
jgi:hypothetical protein